MPYQGAAFIFILGVGLASVALLYLWSEHERIQAQLSHNEHTDPRTDDYPRNSWSRNTDPRNYRNTDPRRRRPSRSNDPPICIICQDDIRSGEAPCRTLPCLHIFHRSCIDDWARERTVCPHCRRAF